MANIRLAYTSQEMEEFKWRSTDDTAKRSVWFHSTLAAEHFDPLPKHSPEFFVLPIPLLSVMLQVILFVSHARKRRPLLNGFAPISLNPSIRLLYSLITILHLISTRKLRQALQSLDERKKISLNGIPLDAFKMSTPESKSSTPPFTIPFPSFYLFNPMETCRNFLCSQTRRSL